MKGSNLMRIGIFTDTYPPFINGVSTSILMLQRALEKKGHEVFIVTVNPDDMTYKFENDKKIVRIPGIPIGIYDYRLTGIYPLRAINIIKKWNLDIIHSHTEFGIGTFARIMANQLDIPLVHTYHTMYEDYVHYITKGYFDGASKKIVEYLTKFYCDKTATELIVPTKKTYDLFKNKYKYNKTVHIIPTGIEIERFNKANFAKKELLELQKKLGIQKEDFVILFVGRLAEEKNVEFLIQVQKELAKKYKHCKLMIVGDGPDSKKYKKMSIDYKIEDQVILTGKVPYEEIPKYYAISTVFATASTTETQGLTVIEAMAASLPPICINDESFNTVVIDGLNGFIFENKIQYKKIITKLIEDSQCIKKVGKQACASANPYSPKYFAERVLDVYMSAIENSGKTKRTFFTRAGDYIKKGLKWDEK